MGAPTITTAMCASPACAGKTCPRDHHAYGYARGDYRYQGCKTHRGCSEYVAAEDSPAGSDGDSPDRSRGDLPGADSPAGADGAPGVAHRPEHDLPGTKPAAEVRGATSVAGLIPFGAAYLCPEMHARCGCQPVRWRVYLERITDE